MTLDRVLPEHFSVRAGSDDAAYVVAVYGELDASTVPDLAREIDRALESGAPEVVIDLSALRFIDSTGLHLMIRAWRAADAAGKELQLLRPPQTVHRAFEISGLDGELPFSG